MVVKIACVHGAPTRAVAGAGDPLDELKQRVTEVVQRFRSEPVTPRSFLDLENALGSLARDACRQILEQEALGGALSLPSAA